MKMDGFTKESEAYRDFKQIYLNGQYTNESMLSELLHYAKQYHIFLNGDESLGSEINSALDGLPQTESNHGLSVPVPYL